MTRLALLLSSAILFVMLTAGLLPALNQLKEQEIKRVVDSNQKKVDAVVLKTAPTPTFTTTPGAKSSPSASPSPTISPTLTMTPTGCQAQCLADQGGCKYSPETCAAMEAACEKACP